MSFIFNGIFSPAKIVILSKQISIASVRVQCIGPTDCYVSQLATAQKAALRYPPIKFQVIPSTRANIS
jgi:hypothetical protein